MLFLSISPAEYIAWLLAQDRDPDDGRDLEPSAETPPPQPGQCAAS